MTAGEGGAPASPDAQAFVVPLRCSDVMWEMGDGSYERDLGWWEGGGVGSLLWNPKGGEGHVLVRVEKCTQGDWDALGGRSYDCGCGGFLGKCDSEVLVCECGKDNAWRDHHYRLLRAAGASPEGGAQPK